MTQEPTSPTEAELAADRRSGGDRRDDEKPVNPDQRAGDDRRTGQDRRGTHQEVAKPATGFRDFIESWMTKNCVGAWRIGTNPRDPNDKSLRFHFDDPEDKKRFTALMQKLISNKGSQGG